MSFITHMRENIQVRLKMKVSRNDLLNINVDKSTVLSVYIPSIVLLNLL